MMRLLLFCLLTISAVSLKAQVTILPDSSSGIGSSIDSLSDMRNSLDSLLRLDSIKTAIEEAKPVHQIASMREIDLTNDGKPEVLRINGYVRKPLGKTRLDFTIKSGKKTLFKESWYASEYFDARDSLSERIKMRLLKRTINSFFANQNFTVIDSVSFGEFRKNVTEADIRFGSADDAELLSSNRVMYNVYAGRNYYFGLVWLPSKHRFVRAWRN